MVKTLKDAYLLARKNDRKLIEDGIKKWWNRGRIDDYVKENGHKKLKGCYVTTSYVSVELEG